MSVATVFDVSDETFHRDVLQRSHEIPVVVDFWAAWCGPCRMLGPILERLARDADGSFALAKVDTDANPRLVMEFGIQGIPAVKAFKDGREVAEFVGALPEAQVRQWLAQLGPSPADDAFAEGADAELRGDLDAAARAYRRVLDQEPGNLDAKRGLARVNLRLRAAGSSEQELRARVAADATDVDAVTRLADLEAARGDFDSAFERLIALVRSTSGDHRERARKNLVNVLDALPPDDPRAITARRSLSAVLF